MPWFPELFSAKYVAELSQHRRSPLVAVPFFDGVTSGEVEALVGSFAGEPELHHPVRGRVKGHAAFRRFIETMSEELRAGACTVEDVDLVVTPHRTVEEVVLRYNVVRWGVTDLPPEAGVAVYVRGQSGLLSAARIYDDSNPPLHT